MFTDPTGYEFKRAINDAPIEYGNVLGDMSLYSNQRGAFSSNNYMSASWWNTNTNPMIRMQEKALWYSEHIEGILDQSVALAFRSVCFWTGPEGPPKGGGVCPNCLDPSSIGNNLLGLSYPGGNNPLTRSGDYSYSYVPTNVSEYPAIGHDRRYDKLGINGASGLFTDTRAIGADWRFVGEELSIAGNPFLNPIDRVSAGILGVGLGLSVLPKTLFQLSKPFGYMQTMMWYNISNQGVNNTPTIHKH